MFDMSVVTSDNFLDMSLSTQALYFHLGMSADDDGFVNPRKVVRMVGSSADELKILIAKKWVIPFEDGVLVITHWKTNNLIRSDRYQPTVYTEHLKRLKSSDNGEYLLLGIPSDNQVDTNGTPSIGKVSIDKDRKEDNSNNFASSNNQSSYEVSSSSENQAWEIAKTFRSEIKSGGARK